MNLPLQMDLLTDVKLTELRIFPWRSCDIAIHCWWLLSLELLYYFLSQYNISMALYPQIWTQRALRFPNGRGEGSFFFHNIGWSDSLALEMKKVVRSNILMRNFHMYASFLEPWWWWRLEKYLEKTHCKHKKKLEKKANEGVRKRERTSTFIYSLPLIVPW